MYGSSQYMNYMVYHYLDPHWFDTLKNTGKEYKVSLIDFNCSR